jgi:hypothetical protein
MARLNDAAAPIDPVELRTFFFKQLDSIWAEADSYRLQFGASTRDKIKKLRE